AMVRGRVLDSLSSAPLGFASIRVYDAGEKTLVNGNITDDDGVFSVDVPFGRYYAVIEFMGYRPLTTGVFSLSGQRDAYDLGRMLLSPAVSTLEEVVVQAEKSTMELSLDK